MSLSPFCTGTDALRHPQVNSTYLSFFPHSLRQLFPDLLSLASQVYGFYRLPASTLKDLIAVTDLTHYSAWRHDTYKRDNRPALHTFNPRPSKARQTKKEEQARRASASSAGASSTAGSRRGGRRASSARTVSDNGREEESPQESSEMG
jgi:hypothetical protein